MYRLQITEYNPKYRYRVVLRTLYRIVPVTFLISVRQNDVVRIVPKPPGMIGLVGLQASVEGGEVFRCPPPGKVEVN